MLRTLRIRNLAVIEDLAVEFAPGLNVLTGETGAGKSIVVDALGLAAGDRADATLVRSGAERGVVEAAFEPPFPSGLEALLEGRGLEGGDGLVVRREIAPGGGGRVFVNGSPTTVGVLREIGDLLVELHGQHEHQSLLSTERHADLLDLYGGHEGEIAATREAWEALCRAEVRRESLRAATADRETTMRSLEATVREIDAVSPREGEREELERDRRILQHAGEMARLLEESLSALLEGEPSASALVASAARRASALADLDPRLSEIAARLESARLEVQDLGQSLADYREDAPFDPERLERLEGRRAALDRLLLRYGPDEAAALRERERAAAELSDLADAETSLAEADRAVEEARGAHERSCAALTKVRRRAAKKLGPAVERQLSALSLERARLEVSFLEPRGGRPGPRGAERVELLLAANPGEPALPLAKVASGGELSRVMLALHLVLEGAGAGRTLVFDEVDAGVGGAVASAVGGRLSRIALSHQVLCVTHLPQVASHAARHYHVVKSVAGGRTVTRSLRLEGEERIEELARMLGGREPSPAARGNAADLLREAAAARRRDAERGA